VLETTVPSDASSFVVAERDVQAQRVARLPRRQPEVRSRALDDVAAVIRHGPRGPWEVAAQHLAALKRSLDQEP
jgi:hypothetical protein